MKAAMVRAGAIGVGVALALVLGVYLVADAASGPLLVTQPGADVAEKVPLGAVFGFTVLGGVAGIGLAVVVDRLRRGPATFVLYAELVAISDQFAEYERMTDRRIPVVMLEPRG